MNPSVVLSAARVQTGIFPFPKASGMTGGTERSLQPAEASRKRGEEK